MGAPTFPVRPEKARELEARLARLGVRECDLDEQFVRSSGAGGQHVNKASTCVLLTHRPSGFQVKAQDDRSQALNRFFARRRLCELLETGSTGHTSQGAALKGRKQKDRQRRRRQLKPGSSGVPPSGP